MNILLIIFYLIQLIYLFLSFHSSFLSSFHFNYKLFSINSSTRLFLLYFMHYIISINHESFFTLFSRIVSWMNILIYPFYLILSLSFYCISYSAFNSFLIWILIVIPYNTLIIINYQLLSNHLILLLLFLQLYFLIEMSLNVFN